MFGLGKIRFEEVVIEEWEQSVVLNIALENSEAWALNPIKKPKFYINLSHSY